MSGMGIHGSKEHCLDIAKLLRQAKKRAVKTALFEFLFDYNGDYMTIFPIIQVSVKLLGIFLFCLCFT